MALLHSELKLCFSWRRWFIRLAVFRRLAEQLISLRVLKIRWGKFLTAARNSLKISQSYTAYGARNGLKGFKLSLSFPNMEFRSDFKQWIYVTGHGGREYWDWITVGFPMGSCSHVGGRQKQTKRKRTVQHCVYTHPGLGLDTRPTCLPNPWVWTCKRLQPEN